jgi:serine O-acetyltransferase
MSSTLAQFLHRDRYQAATIVMNIPQIRQSVDELVCLLFPQRGCKGAGGLENTEAQLLELKLRFNSYMESLVLLDPKLKIDGTQRIETFFNSFQEIAVKLDADVSAAFAGDPAAYSKEEVIITYPGFYAVCIYRFAHTLYKLGVPLLPRLMSEYAHEKTGIDIHPGAAIEESFFIDHGTGVVIGETSIIGKNVKIYQGVTLGALSVKKKMQAIKRHPTIESDVVIYANSIILGGETIVGRGSIIGGNVWLTQSVPTGSVVFNKLETGHTLGTPDGNSPI